MTVPPVIYLFGVDGTGKSTLGRELTKALEQRGVTCHYRWLRFNQYLSKPVNLLGRLTGHSFYRLYPDGTRLGYHHYHKSPFLAWAFILTTLVDTWLATFFKLRAPLRLTGSTAVVDRFVFDTLVDLTVDTGKPGLVTGWVGKFLWRLLPAEAFTVYLRVPKEVILLRRPDALWDEDFDQKSALYQVVAHTFPPDFALDNDGGIEAAIAAILDALNEKEKGRTTE
jgi:hypothetical protein